MDGGAQAAAGARDGRIYQMAIDRFCKVIWWFKWVRRVPWWSGAGQSRGKHRFSFIMGFEQGPASALLGTSRIAFVVSKR
jgi:hypothetical protein